MPRRKLQVASSGVTAAKKENPRLSSENGSVRNFLSTHSGTSSVHESASSSATTDSKSMKRNRKASIDSFFTKKRVSGDSSFGSNNSSFAEGGSIEAVSSSKTNKTAANDELPTGNISMTQEEGFRVTWKTSPGRRNNNVLLRDPNGIFGANRGANVRGGKVSSVVDVQNEVNMIDDLWKSLRSHNSDHYSERLKKRQRNSVELSTSPRATGLDNAMLSALSHSASEPQHDTNNEMDDEFQKPTSRLMEKMKAIHRVNQAKRVKRKRKENFGKLKSNNKSIGVRTSISRLSSKVDLDDLFSDSDSEDLVMNDVDGAQATNLQYDDENIDDIQELDSRKYTVLENSQENKSSEGIDDVGSKCQENKNVFAVNSTVPSPARPHTRPRSSVGDKDTSQPLLAKDFDKSKTTFMGDDDEWALRAMEVTLQQQKVRTQVQHTSSTTTKEMNASSNVIASPTQRHVTVVTQNSASRPLPLYSMSSSKQVYTRFKITSRITTTNKEKKFAVKPDKSFLPEGATSKEDPFALPLIVRLRGFWIHTEVEERDSINIIWDPWDTQGTVNITNGGKNHPVKDLKEAMELNEIVVDDNSHWIILRPDVLISPSIVGTASKCLRQAIISSKIRDSASAKICTLGNLKHDLFENALLDGDLTSAHLRNASLDIVRSRAEECYASGLSDKEAFAELDKFIPKLKDWASSIMARKHKEEPPKQSKISHGVKIYDTSGSTLKLSIENILATEEDILSPMWGLRARPDGSAVVNIEYQHQNMNQNSENDKARDRKAGRYVAPLELKTGNPYQAHQAQALLYARAFMDRYGEESSRIGPPPAAISQKLKSNCGKDEATLGGAILIYLGLRDGKEDQEKVLYVREKRYELQALLGLRNNLARTMANKCRNEATGKSTQDGAGLARPACRALPDVIGRQSVCDMCYVRDACALYHKGWENGTEETSKMGPGFTEAVGHLSTSQMAYFRKWDRLLDLEDSQVHRSTKLLWRIPSLEREARGTCSANLMLLQKKRETINGNVHFRYTFGRRDADCSPVSNASGSIVLAYSPSRPDSYEQFGKRLDNIFCSGDKIVIGVDASHVALARGVVQEVSRYQISISSKIPLAVPSSLQDVLKQDSEKSFESPSNKHVVWCLDKDMYESGMKSSRQNIRRMLIGPPPLSKYQKNKMEKDPDKAARRAKITNYTRRLSSLIVDGKKPEFEKNWRQAFRLQDASNWTKSGKLAAGCKMDTLLKDFRMLNVDQKDALRMCLNAKDYAMVLGMPGTGKTTLIALLVRSLLNQGKRVLLSSFTNSAVDNMLLKLCNAGVEFVRIGNEASVHPRIRMFTPKNIGKGKGVDSKNEEITGGDYRDTVNAVRPISGVKEIIESSNLIGTTCLSCGSGLMQRLRFDVCIVDEASQITEATCLGPLHLADKFILVGDHNQLTAVVRNEQAKKEGLATSLFKRLADLHPQAVCALTHQYRMNREIMSLANCLVYEEKLKCGSETVASRKLKIPEAVLNNPNILPLPMLRKEVVKDGHWLKDILRPDKPVIFVDTDGIGVPCLEKRTDIRAMSPESSNSLYNFDNKNVNSINSSRINHSKGGLVNRVEASLVDTCIAGLLRCRIPIEDIGVICPYRSQLKLLKSPSILGKYGEKLEVQTVDKYQGRDKPCIIVSLVRSNDKSTVGELLRDWRRINVAFTRAMCKLIIFGSYKTLNGSKEKHIITFLAKVRKSGWRYQLQKQGHGYYRHYFQKNSSAKPLLIKRRAANENVVTNGKI